MRINFYGGPGSGKSTTTAWLFSELKTLGKSVEQVQEYVKAWAYQNRKINKFDQIFLFGTQQNHEYRFLANGVKNIVTDSPVFLTAVYGEWHGGKDMGNHLYALNELYDIDFPAINIFLRRNDKPYHAEGRYQTHEEAMKIDQLVKDRLIGYYGYDRHVASLGFVEFDYKDREGILKYVLEHIDD